jgi:hypothetical protein
MRKSLLARYIKEILDEAQNSRVPTQLLSKKSNDDPTKDDSECGKEDKEEIDEENVVGNIAGFMAPLGASSEDMKGPGQKKTKKKSSARWK